uniref:U-box domain-containing protein n=1 Tax=Quercus lobata TaxID=97700 RepID=A0A7N2MDD9_QUELO
MQDPHVATDGFTYEAEVLREWFESGHDTSPITNLKLEHCNLVPNYALRSAIQYRLAEQNVSRVSCGKALPARYSRDTAVSICTDSSHSSHVKGPCFTSREA